jgi:hypothetical protein
LVIPWAPLIFSFFSWFKLIAKLLFRLEHFTICIPIVSSIGTWSLKTYLLVRVQLWRSDMIEIIFFLFYFPLRYWWPFLLMSCFVFPIKGSLSW